MVPEGWREATTGQIAKSFVPGRNKPKEFRGTIPWITTPEITGRFVPSRDHKLFVDKTDLKEAGGKIVPENCVIFSCVGDLGIVTINTVPVVINQQLHAFLPSTEIDRDFLAYQLDRAKPAMLALASTTTIPYLNKSNCESLPILLPPLTEQKRIAEVLRVWDRAIEVAGKQLDLARTQKRALMQTLLTPTRRFPGYDGQPWKEVRLGDVGQIVSGGTPDSTDPSCWDGNIPWATPTDITKLQTRYISTTARNLTEKGVKTSSAHILPAGAILVCTRATIGALAIARNPIATNQGFKSVILRDSHDAEFFYYLLSHNENVMRRLANGSTFLEISKADFESMTFLVPTTEEQKAIATVLNEADAEITTLETQITRLQAEKKALMQQLLTGQKRLAV